jgi:hypothetical protein
MDTIIYEPKPPAAPPQPTPQYELNKDVTGKPPVARGMQVLKTTREDDEGKPIIFELKVPWPPKQSCSACYGRGYIGVDLKKGKLVSCHKCYPLRKMK